MRLQCMPVVAAAIICVVKWICRVFIGLSETFVPFIMCLTIKVEVEGEITIMLHNVVWERPWHPVTTMCLAGRVHILTIVAGPHCLLIKAIYSRHMLLLACCPVMWKSGFGTLICLCACQTTPHFGPYYCILNLWFIESESQVSVDLLNNELYL